MSFVTRLLARESLLLGLLVVVSAALFARILGTATNYDEGVYLGSIEALRHGEALGSTLYAIQPPGFYVLARILANPAGGSVEGIRAGFVLVALLAVVGAWLATRSYGRAAAFVAGSLVAIGAPFAAVAPTVAADVPSVALGMLAVGLAAVSTRAGASLAWPAAAGAVLGLAVMVKFLAAPFAVAVVAVIFSAHAARRALPLVAGGFVVVLAAFLLAYRNALHPLWKGVVADHQGFGAFAAFSTDRHVITSTFFDFSTPFVWLVLAGALCLVAVPAARRTWPLWTATPAAVAFLLYLQPLAPHHVVLLVASTGVAAGASLTVGIAQLPARLSTAVLFLVVAAIAAGFFQQQARLARARAPFPPEWSWAADIVGDITGPRDVVATDLPIVDFLARRSVPGYLSDTSNTRIVTGKLGAEDIIGTLRSAGYPVVVVGRMFQTLPTLLDRLPAWYSTQLRCGSIVIYAHRSPSTTQLCPV